MTAARPPKPKNAFFDDKSATLAVTDHKKYKGKKSADLQKAIDNVKWIDEFRVAGI